MRTQTKIIILSSLFLTSMQLYSSSNRDLISIISALTTSLNTIAESPAFATNDTLLATVVNNSTTLANSAQVIAQSATSEDIAAINTLLNKSATLLTTIANTGNASAAVKAATTSAIRNIGQVAVTLASSPNLTSSSDIAALTEQISSLGTIYSSLGTSFGSSSSVTTAANSFTQNASAVTEVRTSSSDAWRTRTKNISLSPDYLLPTTLQAQVNNDRIDIAATSQLPQTTAIPSLNRTKNVIYGTFNTGLGSILLQFFVDKTGGITYSSPTIAGTISNPALSSTAATTTVTLSAVSADPSRPNASGSFTVGTSTSASAISYTMAQTAGSTNTLTTSSTSTIGVINSSTTTALSTAFGSIPVTISTASDGTIKIQNTTTVAGTIPAWTGTQEFALNTTGTVAYEYPITLQATRTANGNISLMFNGVSVGTLAASSSILNTTIGETAITLRRNADGSITYANQFTINTTIAPTWLSNIKIVPLQSDEFITNYCIIEQTSSTQYSIRFNTGSSQTLATTNGSTVCNTPTAVPLLFTTDSSSNISYSIYNSSKTITTTSALTAGSTVAVDLTLPGFSATTLRTVTFDGSFFNFSQITGQGTGSISTIPSIPATGGTVYTSATLVNGTAYPIAITVNADKSITCQAYSLTGSVTGGWANNAGDTTSFTIGTPSLKTATITATLTNPTANESYIYFSPSVGALSFLRSVALQPTSLSTINTRETTATMATTQFPYIIQLQNDQSMLVKNVTMPAVEATGPTAIFNSGASVPFNFTISGINQTNNTATINVSGLSNNQVSVAAGTANISSLPTTVMLNSTNSFNFSSSYGNVPLLLTTTADGSLSVQHRFTVNDTFNTSGMADMSTQTFPFTVRSSLDTDQSYNRSVNITREFDSYTINILGGPFLMIFTGQTQYTTVNTPWGSLPIAITCNTNNVTIRNLYSTSGWLSNNWINTIVTNTLPITIRSANPQEAVPTASLNIAGPNLSNNQVSVASGTANISGLPTGGAFLGSTTTFNVTLNDGTTLRCVLTTALDGSLSVQQGYSANSTFNTSGMTAGSSRAFLLPITSARPNDATSFIATTIQANSNGTLGISLNGSAFMALTPGATSYTNVTIPINGVNSSFPIAITATSTSVTISNRYSATGSLNNSWITGASILTPIVDGAFARPIIAYKGTDGRINYTSSYNLKAMNSSNAQIIGTIPSVGFSVNTNVPLHVRTSATGSIICSSPTTTQPTTELLFSAAGTASLPLTIADLTTSINVTRGTDFFTLSTGLASNGSITLPTTKIPATGGSCIVFVTHTAASGTTVPVPYLLTITKSADGRVFYAYSPYAYTQTIDNSWLTQALSTTLSIPLTTDPTYFVTITFNVGSNNYTCVDKNNNTSTISGNGGTTTFTETTSGNRITITISDSGAITLINRSAQPTITTGQTQSLATSLTALLANNF